MHQRHVLSVMGYALVWKHIFVFGVVELSMVHVMGWLNLVILGICANLFLNPLKFRVKIAHILQQMLSVHFANENAQ